MRSCPRDRADSRRAVLRPRRSHEPDHRHQLEPARPLDARLVLRGQRRPDLPAGAGHLDRQRCARRPDRARVMFCPPASSCTNRLHAPRRPTMTEVAHKKTILRHQSHQEVRPRLSSSKSTEPTSKVAMPMTTMREPVADGFSSWRLAEGFAPRADAARSVSPCCGHAHLVETWHSARGSELELLAAATCQDGGVDDASTCHGALATRRRH